MSAEQKRRTFVFDSREDALEAWRQDVVAPQFGIKNGTTVTVFAPYGVTLTNVFRDGERVSQTTSWVASAPPLGSAISASLLSSLKNLSTAIAVAKKAVALCPSA